VLLLSLLGMYPLMHVSERGAALLALRAGVLLLPVSLAILFLVEADAWLYVALCGFFASVNYLEAALPALVSKAYSPTARARRWASTPPASSSVPSPAVPAVALSTALRACPGCCGCASGPSVSGCC
jgi:hypothetical protein